MTEIALKEFAEAYIRVIPRPYVEFQDGYIVCDIWEKAEEGKLRKKQVAVQASLNDLLQAISYAAYDQGKKDAFASAIQSLAEGLFSIS